MPTPTVNFTFPRERRRADKRTFLKTSDGDTPVIEQPIRMVSCDTPEKAGYAGKPQTAQPKLDLCRQRLSDDGFYGTLPSSLRNYLQSKLSGEAAQKHIEAGGRAWKFFEAALDERLTGPDGKRRKLGVIPTGQIIDTYGRLLAYLVPFFEEKELPPNKDDPARRTFNLEMIESGWGAFFPVYPSLPRNDDMNRAIVAAEAAWDQRRGAWKEFGKEILLAYEYRMCIKLAAAKTAAEGIKDAFERVCVDMRTMKDVGLFGFADVPPPYRLWYWSTDAVEAKRDLGLT
jgi:endonuclease YncB( thermonuclease family)